MRLPEKSQAELVDRKTTACHVELLDQTTSRAIPPSRQKRGVELDKAVAIAERYPETSEMLSVSLLEELQRIGKFVSYPIGTSFFHKGDAPENCAIILSGKIRISGTNQRAPLEVTTESAGGILGVAALYPQAAGEATAYTVSEVHVIELSRTNFMELLQEPTAEICRFQEAVLRKLLAQQNLTLQDIIEQEGQRPRSSETVPLLRSEIKRESTYYRTVHDRRPPRLSRLQSQYRPSKERPKTRNPLHRQ